MSRHKVELTGEAVAKVINDGRLTSLTQVSKVLELGKGSVSGSVARRLKELVPNIEQLLTANKAVKDGDAADRGKPQASAPQDEGERLCPFKREGSKYRAIWLALWRHRKTGITRKALIEEITTSCKDFADPKTADFAITVVASPTIEGTAHRSANRAADFYYVAKADGGNLRLHLRDAKA